MISNNSLIQTNIIFYPLFLLYLYDMKSFLKTKFSLKEMIQVLEKCNNTMIFQYIYIFLMKYYQIYSCMLWHCNFSISSMIFAYLKTFQSISYFVWLVIIHLFKQLQYSTHFFCIYMIWIVLLNFSVTEIHKYKTKSKWYAYLESAPL